MAEFAKKPAGRLVPGDRTKFGTGYENNWRTVSRVENIGNGIVRVRHKETSNQFYDEWATNYLVEVVAEEATR